MSKSGVVGYIGSIPIPRWSYGHERLHPGHARSVSLAGKTGMVDQRAGTSGQESDAAKALIDQGADIIAQHTDHRGAPAGGAGARIKGFGQASDHEVRARSAQPTAIDHNWDDYYVDRVKAAMDGSWKTGDTWGGLARHVANGALRQHAGRRPTAAKAARKASRAARSSSSSGPINAQDGSAKVKDGEVPTTAPSPAWIGWPKASAGQRPGNVPGSRGSRLHRTVGIPITRPVADLRR